MIKYAPYGNAMAPLPGRKGRGAPVSAESAALPASRDRREKNSDPRFGGGGAVPAGKRAKARPVDIADGVPKTEQSVCFCQKLGVFGLGIGRRLPPRAARWRRSGARTARRSHRFFCRHEGGTASPLPVMPPGLAICARECRPCRRSAKPARPCPPGEGVRPSRRQSAPVCSSRPSGESIAEEGRAQANRTAVPRRWQATRPPRRAGLRRPGNP
jgi:hypothetical protein